MPPGPLRLRPRWKPDDRLRCVVEVDDPRAEVRRDQPVSFRNGARNFALRYVEDQWLPVADLPVAEVAPCT